MTVLVQHWGIEMISVSVREMKAHWSTIERKISEGETVTVLNRGRPTAKIVPADPRKVLEWPDHLSSAVSNVGKSGADTVIDDRGSAR